MRKYIDIIGQKFGKLKVISLIGKDKYRALIYHCICDCGNSCNVTGKSLRKGNVKSCGCLHKEYIQSISPDLIGKKFGRLTVIKKCLNNWRNDTMWLCICDCGNQKIIRRNSLTSGNTTSCGCYNKQQTAKNAKKLFRKNYLVGKHFGRLTVVEEMSYRIYNNKVIPYKCKCECGNDVIINGNSLIYGNTQSCGCFQKNIMKMGNQQPENINKRRMNAQIQWIDKKKETQI